MTIFSEWLLKERESRGMTQTEFAEFLGIDDQENGQKNVAKWETGKTRPRAWRTLAKKLNIDPRQIAAMLEAPDQGRQRRLISAPATLDITPANSNQSQRAHTSDMPNMVPMLPPGPSAGSMPIYGRAAGGADGQLIMSATVYDLVERPPELANAANAYAVLVFGDSMVERYRHGTRLNVHPGYPFSRGDGVVVQIGDPDSAEWVGYIKEFYKLTDDELVLRQYNPVDELRFPRSRVLAIHRVVGTSEI